MIGPGQRLSRLDALSSLTTGGAFFCGEESRLGSLVSGKLADLAVLSADPLTVPEERPSRKSTRS